MNTTPCTIFALNISALISFGEGEYDMALFKLTSALHRTRKLTSRLKQQEKWLQLQQQQQGYFGVSNNKMNSSNSRDVRRQIKFTPATGNFLQVTSDTSLFIVAQPFLVDFIHNESTSTTTRHNTGIDRVNNNEQCSEENDYDGFLTCQDTTLLVALLLFNLGLCHHARGLQQQQQQQQQSQHRTSADLSKAIHFYQLALSSLQHYPATTPSSSSSNSGNDDADLYLLACAMSNNLCLLYADYLLHDRVQSVLDITATMMTTWSQQQRQLHSMDDAASSEASKQYHPRGHRQCNNSSGDRDYPFDFFRFNTQHWLLLRVQPAAAA